MRRVCGGVFIDARPPPNGNVDALGRRDDQADAARRFHTLPAAVRATVLDGLSSAIDDVADAAAPTHRFLRYQWYAAALMAYGGAARTTGRG